ncbi:MAG: LysE family translocator [Flavobacteriia bacterium]|nr:LysE family translocator [Flavobacteriia bacterium]
MFDFVIEGIITGLILSIMIGPVFFVLLETSIRKGVRSAMSFDAGVLVSDLIYIALVYFFFSKVESITEEGENNLKAKIVGGLLFLAYGVFTFFKKQKQVKVDEDGNIIQQDFLRLFFKGFILNFLNPMVIFYWFSILTIHGKESQIPFVSIILITYFSIDFLKILGAKKLRPLVTENRLRTLNHLIGVIFLGFGIVLLVKGIIKIM